MTLKDKMKTYNFWISLVSAVLLLVRIIGDKYGFVVDAGLVMDITTGICGIFVILGIISAPQKNQPKEETNVVIVDQEKNLAQNNKNNGGENQDMAIGRFQNILKLMNQKVQIDENNDKNNTESVQNVENLEISKSLATVTNEGVVEDVAENLVEIEAMDNAQDIVIECDVDDQKEINDDINQNVIELEADETEEVFAKVTEEDLTSKTTDVVNELENLIAELSLAERQELILMLQNTQI